MKRMILPLRASSISSMLSFPPRTMSFRISSMETVRNGLFERSSLSPKQKESRKGDSIYIIVATQSLLISHNFSLFFKNNR